MAAFPVFLSVWTTALISTCHHTRALRWQSNALTNSKANQLALLLLEVHSHSNLHPNEQLAGTVSPLYCTKPELSTPQHCRKFRCHIHWAAGCLSPKQASQHCSPTPLQIIFHELQNTWQHIKTKITFCQLRFLARGSLLLTTLSQSCFGPSAWKVFVLL